MDTMLQGLLIFCITMTTLLSDVNARTRVNVIAGSDVTLKCNLPISDPPQVKWVDWVYNTDRNPQLIYDSATYPDLQVDEDHPNRANMAVSLDFSLTLKNVRFDVDNGEYICRSRRASGKVNMQVFQLGVIALPECSGSTKSVNGIETIQFSCQTHYTGSQVPKVRWYHGNEMLESAWSSDVGMVKEDVTFTGLSRNRIGDRYTCRMTVGREVRTCHMRFNIEVDDGETLPEAIQEPEPEQNSPDKEISGNNAGGNLDLSSLATKEDLYKVRDEIVKMIKQGVNKLDRRIKG